MGRPAPSRRPAAVALGVLVFACPLCSPALASRPWVVFGAITGSYSNSVAWTVCPLSGAGGSAHENLTVSAKLASAKPFAYSGGSGFALVLDLTPGGTFSLGGSYPAVMEPPEGGDGTCGAQQPFQCTGAVVREGPRAELLVFQRSGRVLLGAFYKASSLHESADSERPQSSSCSREAPPLSGGPLLYGLSTDIEPDLLKINDAKKEAFMIPRARLAGARPFTYSDSATPDGGCPRFYYTGCSESGRLTMTLHFRRR